MTSEERKKLRLFEAKVERLIDLYKSLRRENDSLRDVIQTRDDTIKSLNARLEASREDYDNLKTAKMMVISDGDLQSARQRLKRLVREVNRCMELLKKEEVSVDD